MPSFNKDRLYVALYARAGASRAKMPGKEDTYHWALLVGPKIERTSSTGSKYHAKERLLPTAQWEWIFQEKSISLAAVELVLVRVLVAKVQSRRDVEEVLRTTELRTSENGWNCVGWVKEALEKLQATPGCLAGRRMLEWERIRERAMGFANAKVEGHRFDGAGRFTDVDMKMVPTWDLWRDVETAR